MTQAILTNLQLHQIEQEIEKISVLREGLDPEVLEDAYEIARYDEILDHYENLLKYSYKKARVNESGLRLV